MADRPGQTTRVIVAITAAAIFMFLIGWLIYRYQSNIGKPKPVKKTNTANVNIPVNTNTRLPADPTPLSIIPPEWRTYYDQDSGLIVRYPADWRLATVDVAVHPVLKVELKYLTIATPDQRMTLYIGTKLVGQALAISDRLEPPTGTMAKGEPAVIGQETTVTTTFTDQDRLTAVLYYQWKPKTLVYLDSHEVQAEFLVDPTATDTDLRYEPALQLANTIIANLAFSPSPPLVVVEPITLQPLGKYRIAANSMKIQKNETRDTKLIGSVEGRETVVIPSTRTAAGLSAKKALLNFAFPAFGTRIYLTEGAYGIKESVGRVWAYDVVTKKLATRADFPTMGWGRLVFNPERTKAAYIATSAADADGDVRKLYLLDPIADRVTTLLTLPVGQTFSYGWGGENNRYTVQWKDNNTVQYTSYLQESGNKQTGLKKDKFATGEIQVAVEAGPEQAAAIDGNANTNLNTNSPINTNISN